MTGLLNRNEYYTAHYLQALLDDDLKPVTAAWADRERDDPAFTPPDKALRPLATDFFRARDAWARLPSPAERADAQRDLLRSLLAALGHPPETSTVETFSEGRLRLLGGRRHPNGAPWLWILFVPEPAGDPADPLQLPLDPADLDGLPPETASLPAEDLITRELFALPEPPRWILLASTSRLLLVDRSKWHEKRLLGFDLPEIFGRREPATLRALAALLHRDALCPGEGAPLLDRLDENSHKHAFAVSEDLKYSAREAVELLGNEIVFQLREKKLGVYERDIADDLTQECLRLLYRLLFLFYSEARPALGHLPMQSRVYRAGYSLDSLRELENVPLTTEDARNGTYLHQTLATLFQLVAEGFEPDKSAQPGLDALELPLHDTFRIGRLQSHLFDPARTPLFNKVQLRNQTWQQVIRLLSLSRPGGNGRGRGKASRVGRISYAQLGINQLGAVYEGLLSYRGFFAETDLYEVKPAGDEHDPLGQAWFVPEDQLPHYDSAEKVHDDKGRLLKHPKGTFIYRLAGRDREKSASYYTPEVLTRCLVKYALKELIGEKPADPRWKTADQILDLSVCEPAMGSAAFLNEAVNQLAEAYLQRKQQELNRILPVDAYALEKQKVKMFLADQRVFGVDLNPVAVELAEISLWLNCIHPGEFVPWFGLQLRDGNSLIGARRDIHPSARLAKNAAPAWLDLPPDRVPPRAARPPHSVYHWMLPDPGMSVYTDKVVKALEPDAVARLNAWRREFLKPFGPGDIRLLEKLSLKADRLWEQHRKQLSELRNDTTDHFPIFGKDAPAPRPNTTLREKDRRLSGELLSQNVRNSSPYRRLKLAMDYWCALWFWPLEDSDKLPSRADYLLELQYILEGQTLQEFGLEEEQSAQLTLFPDTRPREEQLLLADQLGVVSIDDLCQKFERLDRAAHIAAELRFLHWELEFADLFHARGGFDLILGNPPWVKLEWNEGGLLGEAQPLFQIKKHSASKIATLRDQALTDSPALRADYLKEYRIQSGSQNFLNANSNYPLLDGQKANLYKCFIPTTWRLGQEQAVTGLLHPEGIYDDPRGGPLRAELYPRLRAHFQFQNELSLFAEVDHHMKFGINILGPLRPDPVFQTLANLFAVSTVDDCFESDPHHPVPGIKDDENNWSTRGHPHRIVRVTEEELALFAKLYDKEDTPPLQARLPALHSQQASSVLETFANVKRKLGDLHDDFYSTTMWNETNAQKDGTILRDTQFPKKIENLIISGPHFYLGNAFNKTPREHCIHNSDYDVIDLCNINENYLPRTNYTPSCAVNEYRDRTSQVPWDENLKTTNYYRVINREMLSQSGERTLISAIIPRNAGHIYTAVSQCFKDESICLPVFTTFASIPFDYFVKTTGVGHANISLLRQLPLMENNTLDMAHACARGLILVSLTNAYSNLWTICWQEDFRKTTWTKDDPRLPADSFSKLTETWQWDYALRTDYARRQALVEIDVLVAKALGLSLDELCSIYRIQFPVLRQNEQDTWYDQTGRIVFTCSKGLPGVGFDRKEWNDIKDLPSGTVTRTILDTTQPTGPIERTLTYQAPFTRCDREEDYRVAWEEFEP